MWQKLDISRSSKVSLRLFAQPSSAVWRATERSKDRNGQVCIFAVKLYYDGTVVEESLYNSIEGHGEFIRLHPRTSLFYAEFFKGASNFVYKTRAAITTLQNHLPKKKQGQIGLERSAT